MSYFLGVGPRAVVIHIAARLQRELAGIIHPQPEAVGTLRIFAGWLARDGPGLASADQDVVVETVVASLDVAEAGDGRRVRLMVGRGTSEFRPADHFPGPQIVDVGAALGR